jgi:hypothetical protein
MASMSLARTAFYLVGLQLLLLALTVGLVVFAGIDIELSVVLALALVAPAVVKIVRPGRNWQAVGRFNRTEHSSRRAEGDWFRERRIRRV